MSDQNPLDHMNKTGFGASLQNLNKENAIDSKQVKENIFPQSGEGNTKLIQTSFINWLHDPIIPEKFDKLYARVVEYFGKKVLLPYQVNCIAYDGSTGRIYAYSYKPKANYLREVWEVLSTEYDCEVHLLGQVSDANVLWHESLKSYTAKSSGEEERN